MSHKTAFRAASRALLGVTLFWLLTACSVITTQGVRELNFRTTQDAFVTDPSRLLTDQRVARHQFTSIPKALRQAPVGSVILVCWRYVSFTHFWGPCSHISRKLSATELAESIGIVEGGAGIYPITRLYNRYAVIVLDVGVRDEHVPVMRAEVERLNGLPYDVSNREGTYYCSTYQNRLQRVMALPDVVPFNPYYNMFIPAEVLLQPGVRVLWVGVNEHSPRRQSN